MKEHERIGILLINTGSPEAPKTAETRVYLRQFLSDPRMLDIPAWKRWLILNLFILPFRPKASAEAYEKIWRQEGSPLLSITEEQRAGLQSRLPNAVVEVGMRYGQPSIPDAVRKLMDTQIDRLIVAPLYPQYSSAANGSALELVYELAGQYWNVPAVSALPPFYDDPLFLDAWQAVAKSEIEAFKPDHVLFSYHGLPERHVKKSDPTGSHCLVQENCCDTIVEANRYCYRAHCIATTKALNERLGIAKEQCTISFQSRLGSDPWIQPATDELVPKFPKQGIRRLAVLCPAFVTDCLETLEEIGLRAREDFLGNGGEDFTLIPCLNSHPVWLDNLAAMLRRI